MRVYRFYEKKYLTKKSVQNKRSFKLDTMFLCRTICKTRQLARCKLNLFYSLLDSVFTHPNSLCFIFLDKTVMYCKILSP